MCLGENFVVICAETIDDKKERKSVLQHLKDDKKELILITEKQMHQFAGNMLQVRGTNDERFLIMSSSAHDSLTSFQITQIEKHL